ncbi:NAD(P)H-hydrate dehydratase, partial [Klebsiella pneumoniae]|uniref:NAD(P)H-hydrate dehydratase n=1 Tax=Klebsiella pneumoniae TaxID=573 RepID=UPI0039C2511B
LVRARPAGTTLLTPHPLEAARLLGRDTVGVQANRLAAAHELAERLGCTVVLKGSGSVIATPGERPAISASGGPALA